MFFFFVLFFWFIFFFFFFNDTATTEIYTLSLHDALPISRIDNGIEIAMISVLFQFPRKSRIITAVRRSEEHTSELQSHVNLVCRLLLEKKKNTKKKKYPNPKEICMNQTHKSYTYNYKSNT